MITGVWAAVPTPVDADLLPDPSKAVPYYLDLLLRGCDGINALGTTGEAMSLSTDQRLRFMDALASSDLPMEKTMAGTGAASLGDAVRLTRNAFECGFAAALVMPPFFYRDASHQGIIGFFDALFERANPPRKSVLLYNFPRMSGITFCSELVDRLLARFPETIAGMKDSSNDAGLQTEILARHPDQTILPGSESSLVEAKARGVAGCISGSVALWPELARAVFSSGDRMQGEELTRCRAALDGMPFIAAVRHLTAAARNDPAWERALPPNVPLTPQQRRAFARLQGECR
jgi:4-hydroxy-tetrahydrodipicolinate synthase